MYKTSFFTCLVLFLLAHSVLYAQYPRKDFDWEPGRKNTYQPSTEEKQMAAVIILDDRYYDYTVSPDPDRGFDLYETRHKIVYVNDDKGIDQFNKVYIPLEKDEEIVKLKARTISQDGKVVEVNKDNIKDVSNYEEYANLKIFALEGLEKGAEIEYLYTVKKDAETYGTDFFQNDLNVKEAGFTLTSPQYLEFETKSYNGFPDVTKTEKDSLNILTASARNIPAMQEEEYSAWEANRMQVAYKLAYNHKVSDDKLVTWNTAANRYYSLLYRDIDKMPKLGKLIKELKLSKLNEEDKIRAVEHYVKGNITYKKASGTDLADPNMVLDQKVGNEIGLTRVYNAIFRELGITSYLALTCSRFEGHIDPEFVNYDNLSDILIYFPAYQKYLVPASLEYRYGPAPILNGGNYGLFIMGPYSGEARRIPLLNVEQNQNVLDAELTISPDMDMVTVNDKEQWTGYRAYLLREFYELSDADGKTEILKEYSLSGIDDAKVNSRDIQNMKMDDSFTDDPAMVTTNYSAASLIENAGKSYLLNIGKIIGVQSELYQKNERMNDIDMESPDQYKRHIYFKIPAGYKVKGLDDVNIDKSYSENGRTICQFVSSYTIKGDTVDINVHEFYKFDHMPRDRYEDWRHVINAASDFNKVALVLEKE